MPTPTVEEQAVQKVKQLRVGDHVPPPLGGEGGSPPPSEPQYVVEEANLRGGATKPRVNYHVDTAMGRVYLRTFSALEAEVCDQYEGTEATAALMALAITNEHGSPKYVVDDPDHPEHGWRFLVDLDHGVFATIAKAIKSRAGAATVGEAVKN